MDVIQLKRVQQSAKKINKPWNIHRDHRPLNTIRLIIKDNQPTWREHYLQPHRNITLESYIIEQVIKYKQIYYAQIIAPNDKYIWYYLGPDMNTSLIHAIITDYDVRI